MTALIDLKDVTRRLVDPEPVTLVREVSLEIQPGEFVAVVGPSGCGKSSLLYLLGLLDRPDAGSVRIDGRATETLSEVERTHLRLERIGFVFQFHFLLPELTAEANVALPIRRLGRYSRREADDRAHDLLAKLGLQAEAHRRPDRMSGGQRQRVAIARALANDPAIILGDEPTGNLDSVNTRLVVEEFQRLAHQEGRAVVCVTHDAGVAAAADRRIHMLDGRIVPET
ncbi:ABC transporter ATP-binding protein [Phenylobacterium aquaticum]|uniref:ABC transporter ATP-binding protein n=1 Tax=Phenylobacterium aquaticum TaxID=1763816 RepID=UPI001F5CA275|nr:ABC transporter ATP-binding protein [Phenylobacterium aquaticum]MCI3134670.1 ABC transporter ATP-binding protein [Phenylobacterium aquaticum]